MDQERKTDAKKVDDFNPMFAGHLMLLMKKGIVEIERPRLPQAKDEPK